MCRDDSGQHKCSQTDSLRIGCSATAAATSGHSIVVAGANARPGRAKRSTIPPAIGRDRDLEHYERMFDDDDSPLFRE